jgi:hypothetical protein
MLAEFSERAAEPTRFETLMDVGVTPTRSASGNGGRRHRTSRRQREVQIGWFRRHRRERDAEVPEAAARLPDGMEGRHSEAALAYDGSQRSASAMQAPPIRVSCTAAHGGSRMRRGDGGARPRRSRALASYTIQTSFASLSGHARSESSPRSAARAHLLFIAPTATAASSMVLGSTTEYVLRNAPCPVF